MLPIILSFPHGGLEVPAEIAGRLALDATAIYNECDLWIEQLFGFASGRSSSLQRPDASSVLAQVSTPIARAIVDVNRPPGGLDDPDGPVKAQTSYGEPTYRIPLDLPTKEALIERYWQPYHDELRRAFEANAANVQLFVDCHNMAQRGPTTYGDPGQTRPLICLANLGDRNGEPTDSSGATSCSSLLIRRAAHAAHELFAGMELLQPHDGARPAIVAINRPFAGGYILRSVSDQSRHWAGRRIPGLMIEVNRGLLVGDQGPNTPIAPPNAERISVIQRLLVRWLGVVVMGLE